MAAGWCVWHPLKINTATMLIAIRVHVTQCYNGPLMLFKKQKTNHFWTTAWFYANWENKNMVRFHTLKFILYWRGEKICLTLLLGTEFKNMMTVCAAVCMHCAKQ